MYKVSFSCVIGQFYSQHHLGVRNNLKQVRTLFGEACKSVFFALSEYVSLFSGIKYLFDVERN